ncbi:MAG: sigma-70 family RNA polymerase sigma factor [Armatimonadota bacterium]
MPVSERDLTARAQNGDVAAFDELVSRHQDRVFTLAYHILGDAEDAADVQQDAFLLAWKNLRSFRGQASFGTWLHKITVNCCMSVKRKKTAYVYHEELDEDEPICSGQTATVCQDTLINAITVRQLLADLPERARIALLLREVDGMSIDEIADVMGASYRAVVQQLWRARKLFRERFRQYFTEDTK